MTGRSPGQPSGHDQHDRLLVVRFAANDTEPTQSAQAEAQIDRCPDCARLAADTRLLQSSMAALPSARRPRDFRLTAQEADQLRGSAFDRLLRRFALPRLALVRPVAAVAIAVGLTITVVGAGLPSTYLSAPAAPGYAFPTAADTVTLSEASAAASGTPAGAPVFGAMGSDRGGITDQAPYQASASAAPLPFDTAKSGASAPSAGTGATSFGVASTSRAPAATPTTSDAGEVAPVAGGPTAGGPTVARPTAGSPTVAPPNPTPAEQPAAADETARLMLIYGGVTLAMLAFGVLLLSLYARRRNEDPLLR